jgi:hypothetical protein
LPPTKTHLSVSCSSIFLTVPSGMSAVDMFLPCFRSFWVDVCPCFVFASVLGFLFSLSKQTTNRSSSTVPFKDLLLNFTHIYI